METIAALPRITSTESTSPTTTEKDIRKSSGTSNEFSALHHALLSGYEAIDVSPSPFLEQNLFILSQRWVARYDTIRSKSAEELFQHFTHDGRYQLITPAMEQWPKRLDDLLIRTQSSPPLCLWCEGDASIFLKHRNVLAVVGSRESNDYGERCSHEIGRREAQRGCLIVSGGAMGIDASAHWGALAATTPATVSGQRNSGSTVAIFAGGLRHQGPSRNQRLFSEIVASGGALVSELPPDTIPYASRFLARNRLIAALSDCTIVTQARYRSGALNTAQWAAELGRSVLAIPGNIDTPANAGCNRLITEQKATMLSALTDVELFLPTYLPSPLTPEAVPKSTLESGRQEEETSDDKNKGKIKDNAIQATQHIILKGIRRFRAVDRTKLFAWILSPTTAAKNVLPEGLTETSLNQQIGLLELTGKITIGEDSRLRLGTAASRTADASEATATVTYKVDTVNTVDTETHH
jgi:DNA protecting protein DprA